jgi:hypothetical protein
VTSGRDGTATLRRTGGLVIAAILTATAAGAGLLTGRRPPEPAAAALRSGPQLVMVFIASSTCAGVNDPALRDAVRRVRNGLQHEAGRRDQTFVTIGVSLDTSIDVGVALLRRFGRFDEISVGYNWLNGAAVKYVWHDMPGAASMPQILVIERDVEVTDAGVRIRSERARYRKVGSAAIAAWSRIAFTEE